MANEIAQYTFVPWLRQGMAVEIEEADQLGAAPGATIERAELSVDLVLTYTALDGSIPGTGPAINKRIQLVGPGDVVGIKRDAIIRTQPCAGAASFAANGLAYVEFYDEDFPWRYSPARPARAGEPADRRHKLRPWIALWVLQDDEFERGPERAGKPRTIRLRGETVAQALPLHTEIWAWAHVQISRSVGDASGVNDAIRTAPDHALSRLLCPRKLRPETSYHAFIVPAFETGRLAGLGEDTAAVAAQAPSWQSGAMPHSPVRPLEYPIYHHWSFRTGLHGDFESLARALIPGPVGQAFGKRKVDVRTPGYGMDGAAAQPEMEVEGALKPPDLQRTSFPGSPGSNFATRLEKVLDLSANLEQGQTVGISHPYHVPGPGEAYGASVPDDPILAPPIYGRHHADVTRVADAASDAGLSWLRELNLDPRNRAAAGLGVEVVQRRQDELVERAWEQVGELEQANQRLREAELTVSVAEAIFAKHLVQNDTDRVLQLTAAAQRRVLGTTGATTVRAEIEASQVPAAAQTAAFKRATRPQRKVMRRLTGTASVQGFHHGLLEGFNAEAGALSAARPNPEPGVALALSAVSSAVQASISEFSTEGTRPGHIFLELLVEDLRARLTATPGHAPENIATLSLDSFRNALRARLEARIPASAPPADRDKKLVVQSLIAAITALVPTGAATADVRITQTLFQTTYGSDIGGKSFSGVTVVGASGPGSAEIAKMTAMNELTDFHAQIASFNGTVVAGRPEAPPPPRLAGVSPLAATTLGSLRPRHALALRVTRTLRGIALPPEDEPRRMRPVMAHPAFPDAMFEDLRRRSQDFIIPNFRDLPQNTITLLEPNQRFIESYLAGLNEEMARELLWREYPTDQRGTYFRTFWDTRDDLHGQAAADIKPMHRWSGDLGQQSERAGTFLVLVIRGELLEKYPSTVVYAQRAVFGADVRAPRQLADEGNPANLRFPVFQGRLDPDISMFGFALGKDEARGYRPSGPGDPRPAAPGWFFVLRERPGEANFGLDDAAGEPLPALASWNDLSWGHLGFPAAASSYIAVAHNAGTLALDGSAGAGLPTAAQWGKSAADQAYILLQNPMLYARHAEELLP